MSPGSTLEISTAHTEIVSFSFTFSSHLFTQLQAYRILTEGIKQMSEYPQARDSFSSKYVGSIPHLDHLNYNIWCPNVRVHLEAIKGYRIVTGDLVPPELLPDASNNQAVLDYHVLEAKVKGFLLATCSLPARRYLAGIESAREMWSILKDRFDSTVSTKGRLAIRKQFKSTRPVPGQPLSHFISTLHALQYQLTGTEHAIDDETFKDHLLVSLPASYSTLVEIIHERESSITVAEVIHQIQQAEITKASKDSHSESVSPWSTGASQPLHGVGLVSSQMPERNRYGGRARFRGRFSSSSGLRRGRSTPYPAVFTGRCNSCGIYGH